MIVNIHYLAAVCILLCPLSCSNQPRWEDYKGGTQFSLAMEPSGNADTDKMNAQTVGRMLERRLDAMQIKERILKVDFSGDIVVQVPPIPDAKTVGRLLSGQNILEFLPVLDAPLSAQGTKDDSTGILRILYSRDSSEMYVTEKDHGIRLSGYVESATAQPDPQGLGGSVVLVQLNSEGARLLAEFTGNNVERRVAIVFDDVVYSVPTVKTRIIAGAMMIDGLFSEKSASDMAAMIMAGNYPVPLRLVETKALTRDAWLGATR